MSSQTTTQTKPKMTTWSLDAAHSSAEFSVRHMMIANVRGRVPIKEARIEAPGDDITRWRVFALLDATGIDTGVADRDAHLRSADFFDVDTYPNMRFESTRIETPGNDKLRIVGNLTIRDVTHEVVLEGERSGEATDPWGATRVGIEASTTIDRKAWNLSWNQALETGGILVGDKVKVTLQVQAVRGD